jgi:hypothetical protein
MNVAFTAGPMELLDEQLDAVAAGGGCKDKGDPTIVIAPTVQVGGVNIEDTNIGVNVGGTQIQST